MSIVSCPRCGDKVSVPPAASPAALVQCPLCCEEYYLSDALIQLPPLLKVVGGPTAAAESAADYRLAEPVAAAVSEGAFDVGVGSVTPSRPQLRTVARPRRPDKSPVGEIIKVVLGGAAGLAGGLLVLWWVFGVDVGNLGPQVSKVNYLRFLVPKSLWHSSVRAGNEAVQLEPLAGANPSGKVTDGKPNKRAARRAADGDSPPTSAAVDHADAKNQSAKSGDPFLTLDDLGSPVAPAGDSTSELRLDDPLSAVSPPEPSKDKPATESNPAGAGDDGIPEKKAGPKPADKSGEASPSTTSDQPVPASGREAGQEEKPKTPALEQPSSPANESGGDE